MSSATRTVRPANLPRRWRGGRTARLSLAVALAGALGCEPIGPVPGGELDGEVAAALLDEWSFTDALETVEVETRPGDPYSVTTWAIGYRGHLYVPTKDPDSRRWVGNVRENPEVRVRVDGTLYPGRLVEVSDPEEFEAVGSALIAKYDIERPSPEEKVAIFRLDPR